ncbi:MAG: HIT domain-containing protein [Kiritimatiellaeota bacterium]|nr:HIT domain-containing protein [Kiritimatiellota bacterium]
MQKKTDPTPGSESAPPEVRGADRPLWAPWRIEYIRGPHSGRCFFCEKAGARGADKANHVVGRGKQCFVLLNDFPYNSGHLMIAPYRHVGDLDALCPEELSELFDLAVLCERVLKSVMNPEGFNFGFNIGAAAGAGVRDHVHGHMVPRWVGDTNFMPVLGSTRVVPEALDETARVLRKAWLAETGENGDV